MSSKGFFQKCGVWTEQQRGASYLRNSDCLKYCFKQETELRVEIEEEGKHRLTELSCNFAREFYFQLELVRVMKEI